MRFQIRLLFTLNQMTFRKKIKNKSEIRDLIWKTPWALIWKSSSKTTINKAFTAFYLFCGRISKMFGWTAHAPTPTVSEQEQPSPTAHLQPPGTTCSYCSPAASRKHLLLLLTCSLQEPPAPTAHLQPPGTTCSYCSPAASRNHLLLLQPPGTTCSSCSPCVGMLKAWSWNVKIKKAVNTEQGNY